MTEPLEVQAEAGDPAEEEAPEAPAEPSAPTPEEEEAAEEEEAQQAEPEPAEEGPAAHVGLTEKQLEAGRRKIEQAGIAYAKKITDVMGEEATMLEQCPRCTPGGFLGFYFPLAPVEAETKIAVLTSIGEAPALATKTEPYSRRCDTCDGAGVVLSGSRVNTQRALQCIACHGKGWVAVGDERRVPSNAVPQPVPANGQAEIAEPAPDTDPWGRSATDPDYGRIPMYVPAR